ncbi:urocanate hydratase, partial [Vibrio parahaemolyticus]|nr:urocanate hydratase [Vibrio parahaemolyticus]
MCSHVFVHGIFLSLVSVAKKHFNGDGKGRWVLNGGLGGMGGAQPRAGTMAGFSMIAVECDESRIDYTLRHSYVD